MCRFSTIVKNSSPIQRPISPTSREICRLQTLRAKSTPGMRAVDPLGLYIVHGYGNPQHRSQRDQIGADMAVSTGGMVGAPVFQYVAGY